MISTAEILIKGRNRQVLFDKLAKRNVNVLNIKNIDEKSFIVTVDVKDSKKVFTICGNMWYNKLVKINGFRAVCEWVKRHLALCLGTLFLFVVAFYFDNVILDVDIQGVKSVSVTEITQKLESFGVKRFSKFSSLDIEKIKKEVNSISENFSFVTVQKRGNRLIVDVSERQSRQTLKDFSKKQIVSDVNGRIVSANVYRGKLVKNVGDEVFVGDVLIDGVFTFNEENFQTYAFGKVVVEVEREWEFFAKSDCDFERAKAIALAKFHCENNAELKKITVEPFLEGYVYRVTLNFFYVCGG